MDRQGRGDQAADQQRPEQRGPERLSLRPRQRQVEQHPEQRRDPACQVGGQRQPGHQPEEDRSLAGGAAGIVQPADHGQGQDQREGIDLEADAVDALRPEVDCPQAGGDHAAPQPDRGARRPQRAASRIEGRHHQRAEQRAGEAHGEWLAIPRGHERGRQVDVKRLLAHRAGEEHPELTVEQAARIEPLRGLVPPEPRRRRVQIPGAQNQRQPRERHQDEGNGVFSQRARLILCRVEGMGHALPRFADSIRFADSLIRPSILSDCD